MTEISRRGFLGRLAGIATAATVGPKVIEGLAPRPQNIAFIGEFTQEGWGNGPGLDELSAVLKQAYSPEWVASFVNEETPFRKALRKQVRHARNYGTRL
jgi:hypothetical protein